jgi:hypothetical protein
MISLYDRDSTDNRITTTQDQHGNDYVNIRQGIARGCVLRRDIIQFGTNQEINLPEDEIDKASHDESPQQSYQYVAWIMKTEIHARPTIDQRPKDEENA